MHKNHVCGSNALKSPAHKSPEIKSQKTKGLKSQSNLMPLIFLIYESACKHVSARERESTQNRVLSCCSPLSPALQLLRIPGVSVYTRHVFKQTQGSKPTVMASRLAGHFHYCWVPMARPLFIFFRVNLMMIMVMMI